jgi:hypothetical protein
MGHPAVVCTPNTRPPLADRVRPLQHQQGSAPAHGQSRRSGRTSTGRLRLTATNGPSASRLSSSPSAKPGKAATTGPGQNQPLACSELRVVAGPGRRRGGPCRAIAPRGQRRAAGRSLPTGAALRAVCLHRPLWRRPRSAGALPANIRRLRGQTRIGV